MERKKDKTELKKANTYIFNSAGDGTVDGVGDGFGKEHEGGAGVEGCQGAQCVDGLTVHSHPSHRKLILIFNEIFTTE